MPYSRDSSFRSGSGQSNNQSYRLNNNHYDDYSSSDDDMKFRKIGSFFSSIKQEAKPFISSFANEARNKGSSVVRETRSRLADSGYIAPSSSSAGESYVSSRSEFTNVKDNSNYKQSTSVIDSDGNSVLDIPENAEFTLYPSYTLSSNQKYYVEVRGWLTCPGTMGRKNRIIFSLAKQLIKPGAHTKASDLAASGFAMQATGHADPSKSQQSLSVDEQPNSDVMSIRSNNSELSLQSSLTALFYDPATSGHTAEDILKERIAYFFARSLTNVPLNIVICSEDHILPDDLVRQSVVTDLNGKFEITIETPYKPSLVQVSVSGSINPVFAFQEIQYIGASGISVISDIDDTIKHTDVLSDKRTVFNNVFVKDLEDAAIPGVANWYSRLNTEYNAMFHYVSNSPWQIYPTMQKFLKLSGYPEGSIHLKQYTGNILSSLMEPAVERKRQTLYKLFEEFPKRKFLLIGDSGEQDIEAYLDVARRFPCQVLRIYIRVVPGLLSDFNDIKILRDMKRIISLREEKVQLKNEYMKFASNLNVNKSDSSFFNGKKRTPPPVPPSRKLADLLASDMNDKEANFENKLTDVYNGIHGSENNNFIDIDSSSPETSEDEMENPNYDWNILSHRPLQETATLTSESAASASATATAAAAIRNSRKLPLGYGLQQTPPPVKPPVKPRKTIPSKENTKSVKSASLKEETEQIHSKISQESLQQQEPKRKKPPMVPKKPKGLQSGPSKNSTSQISISGGFSTTTGSAMNVSTSERRHDSKPKLPPRPSSTSQLSPSSLRSSSVSLSTHLAATSSADAVTINKNGYTSNRRDTRVESPFNVNNSSHLNSNDSLMEINSKITRSTPAIPSTRKSSTLTNSNISFDPAVIKHSATDVGIITSASAQGTQIIDRKGELWLQRLTLTINSLPDHVGLKFWIAPSDVENDSFDCVLNETFE